MIEQGPPSRIPEFQNREEEAAFWDTHDFTDYWDEFKPVEVEIDPAFRARVAARAEKRRELVDHLTVRLDRGDREELALYANEHGVGPSTVVRIWIKERLRGERAAG